MPSLKCAKVGAVVLVASLLSGCVSEEARLLKEVKDLNKTSVMKLRACFEMYASRNGRQYPESEEELIAFLTSGEVDANLERIGIDSTAVEDIFTSQRDGQPLKVRYGIRYNPNKPLPIAFETTGVDGVRLVSADVLIEVDNDQDYEKLWKGEYVSRIEKLRKASGEGL
ncbi:hypothetical protein MalM25_22230 [Planctomycetes bacterium MalM25]|nr:hypothetical protein MalM25_22230 [Planctomycetes bacterium MalM25]